MGHLLPQWNGCGAIRRRSSLAVRTRQHGRTPTPGSARPAAGLHPAAAPTCSGSSFTSVPIFAVFTLSSFLSMSSRILCARARRGSGGRSFAAQRMLGVSASTAAVTYRLLFRCHLGCEPRSSRGRAEGSRPAARAEVCVRMGGRRTTRAPADLLACARAAVKPQRHWWPSATEDRGGLPERQGCQCLNPHCARHRRDLARKVLPASQPRETTVARARHAGLYAPTTRASRSERRCVC